MSAEARRGAGPEAATAGNQRLYLDGALIAQMSDTLPIDLTSAALGVGRPVSGIADPFNGPIDEFRISHVQRCGDGLLNKPASDGSAAAAALIPGRSSAVTGRGEGSSG